MDLQNFIMQPSHVYMDRYIFTVCTIMFVQLEVYITEIKAGPLNNKTDAIKRKIQNFRDGNNIEKEVSTLVLYEICCILRSISHRDGR